ncbi:hypothetical protein EV359DRAFT_84414 [Lentinula novae-zelandiae]|nr:hypothetical protein EV359DRAFT_84414 [Lentinula novae-zelandiae]
MRFVHCDCLLLGAAFDSGLQYRYANFPSTVTIWLSLLSSYAVIGTNVNITVDDSDPSILYQPQEHWFTNTEYCATCFQPDASLAFNNSYHLGNHNISLDTDDFAQDNTLSGHHAESGKGKNDHYDHIKNQGKRRETRMRRLDSDDTGFVDSPVTAQFSFNGNAIYLFCVEPLSTTSPPITASIMNLTFILDTTLSGSFVHVGSSSTSGFASNVSVFSVEDLDDGPHVLLVNVLPGSAFVFDYLVYTVNEQISSPTSTSNTTMPTARANTKDANHRNIGTFAGAVGGSVGVLGTLALCIFLSIWTRRRRSAKRERIEQARERELASARNTPPIIGPAPFIPRYFPRIGPAAPPPYIGPTHNVRDTSFFHTSSPPSPNLPPGYPQPVASSIPLSYADIPPSIPPPPLLDEVEAHWIALPPSPPPPFGGAIGNSASTADVTEITSPLEVEIPTPTHAHDRTTSTTASHQEPGVDTVTEDPGVPTLIAPG